MAPQHTATATRYAMFGECPDPAGTPSIERAG